jgi:hypothetical protein
LATKIYFIVNCFLKNFFFFLKKNINFTDLINVKTRKIFFYNLFFIFTKNIFSSRNVKKRRSLANLKKKKFFLNKKYYLYFYNFFFFYKRNLICIILKKINVNLNPSYFVKTLLLMYKKTLGDGFLYLRGLFIIFFIDAGFTDDEPL